MTGIRYEDFLDLDYEPAASDLVCSFHVEPAADMDMESAASRVASESSNGTWAELQVSGGITDLSATAFDIDGSRVQVAYPDELFEDGNMAQVLSCIAGNIMGMKAVERIRLLDCEWPEPLATTFPGPQSEPSTTDSDTFVAYEPSTMTSTTVGSAANPPEPVFFTSSVRLLPS